MRNAALAVIGAVTLGGVSAIAASLVQPVDIAQRDYTPAAIEDPVQDYLAQRDQLKSDAEARDKMIERQTARADASVVDEGIEVQARRLPNGTLVAVHGEVAAAYGKMLIVDRPDGRVHVRLPGAMPALMRGDDVTVYGRLASRSDEIAVQAEAVLQRTSLDTATLHMGPSKLESVNKFNRSITHGAAKSALEHYRLTYTAL